MNCLIEKITLGKDGFVYAYLKPPCAGSFPPESSGVTVKYPIEALAFLRERFEEDQEVLNEIP